MCLLLYIFYIYLYLFNLQYMWVDPVVNKAKWPFLFMHNWIPACFRQRGSKPEVSEDVDIFHEWRI